MAEDNDTVRHPAETIPQHEGCCVLSAPGGREARPFAVAALARTIHDVLGGSG